jgi:hypothetical protein
MPELEEKDVVISWFSDASIAKDAFVRPTHFIQMPTPQPTADNQEYDHQLEQLAAATGTWNKPLLGLLKRYAPGIRPQRVALVGFSQGCRGPRAMLKTKDGRRIDSVIACDGIHAQFAPGSKTRIDPSYLAAWTAFARLASDGSRLAGISTSSIAPPYPTVSTTSTSDWIWREATGLETAEVQSPIPEIILSQRFDPPVVYPAGQSGQLVWPETTFDAAPIMQVRNQGGLWVLNYGNLDPTGHNDHLLQAHHVLPMMLTTLLAARWNRTAPSEGICVLAGAGEGVLGAPGCFAPTRLSDAFMRGEGEDASLDLDLHPNPLLPASTARVGELVVDEPTEDPWIKGMKWAAGVFAGAVLLEVARRAGTYVAEHPKLFGKKPHA